MLSRLRHFRAAFLLAMSSSVLFWPVSYWLPLPDYLAVLSSSEYKDYELVLRSIVSLYLIFVLLNLVLAGVFATKVNSKVKFSLALTPAVLLLILPFAFTIPVAQSYPDRNYFEVFQALFKLLRFSKPELLFFALLATAIAVGLNIWAALIVLRAGEVDKIPNELRNRYLIYTGVVITVAAIAAGVMTVNSVTRSLDRDSCRGYLELPIPQSDEEVPVFLSDVRLLGDEAGSRTVRETFVGFTDLSRQFYTLLNQEENQDLISQYQAAVIEAKDNIAAVCSEYTVR